MQDRVLALFRIGVLLKGAQGALELIASVFVYFVPLHLITFIADHFTEEELLRDPDDFFANHLHDYAYSISLGAKDFAAIYLFIHGVVKIVLALALLSGKRWAYPAALVLLGALIVYQIYRITLHHSVLLMLATIVDCFIFYFIAREYGIVRHQAA